MGRRYRLSGAVHQPEDRERLRRPSSRLVTAHQLIGKKPRK